MFKKPERFGVYLTRTFHEMVSIGIGSLPIVIIISVFVGAVTTIQTAYQLVTGLVPITVIGSIVTNSNILELAPTLTCLVLSGRVGSSIASEIGTMRVTEQIDALEVMGINSKSFLGLPKIVAGITMIPLLIFLAMALSIWGGITAGSLSEIITTEQFLAGAKSTFRPYDVFFGSLKAFTFGFIITSVASYMGYFTQGGALEVGRSSTQAVVYSSVMILVFDYLIAQLFL